jgi:hypothetical protein
MLSCLLDRRRTGGRIKRVSTTLENAALMASAGSSPKLTGRPQS